MKWPAVLRARDYRDPAVVYEETEARTCQGCAHIERLTWEAETFEHCGKGRRFGRKCGLYEEGKNAG